MTMLAQLEARELLTDLSRRTLASAQGYFAHAERFLAGASAASGAATLACCAAALDSATERTRLYAAEPHDPLALAPTDVTSRAIGASPAALSASTTPRTTRTG